MYTPKNFKLSEFYCNCGECQERVKEKLIRMVDKARSLAGIPFVLTSAQRCLVWNRKVGSKDTSSHIKGLAVDIKFNNNIELFHIMRGLIGAGFVRIGINRKLGFVHADIDEDKPQCTIFPY